MKLSAIIITRRLFHRSMYAPASGPSRICGINATVVAVARTVADPVSIVSHQTSANCAATLPISESCCPVQIVKKGGFQLDLFLSMSWIELPFPLRSVFNCG